MPSAKQVWTRRGIVAYGVLLAASTIYRWRRSSQPLPAGMLAQTLVVDHGQAVTLAYRDSAPGSSLPVVFLIHGSPGSSRVMSGLARLLPARYRLIIPDLPGFGASTHSLPNYSFDDHARYLLALMDRLSIDRAHLVGFSMGGGVVLCMEARAPQRVNSITMLSAIGVQEQELLGGYWKNHALHAAQLGLLAALRAGTPHFGLLDRDGLNVEYARNFYDSDQRPLRAILERYQGPMLIIHGTQDRNVPVAAAYEHHRLVPQSELVIFEGNHFATFERPQVIAPPLIAFLDRQAR